MHDLVIRNGRIIDGTGSPAFSGDIAIDGGTITEVGQVGSGKRTLNADGLLVTPGFVDMHTHYDGQVTWDPYLTPSSWHGCTTVVMGNCGVGFSPVKRDRRDWLIGLMEGVEDIPGAALAEGIEWEWESFPEYLDAIERKPHVIDFGTQITHGSLRAYVMDERGAANESATPKDIAQMYALVKEGIEAGALGFSTSRTMLHKSIEGVPVPGTFATPDEIFGIGRALRDAGAGVFQLASEHLTMATEFEWMKVLASEMGRPVIFNLSQANPAPTLWKDLLTLLEEAAEDGIPIYGQVAGRAIGIVMNWECTAHPFVAYPSYMEIAGLPPAERIARLRNPAVRARILGDTPVDLGEFNNFVTRSFELLYPLRDAAGYEPDPADCLASLAQRTGKSPQELAYDAMLERDGKGSLYFPLFNYADGNLELLHTLHQHPQTRMGLSDGGAHCGAICDGGMPTFMLTHWTRDRSRGPRLPLEHIVMRQTSQTAQTFGMFDRGILAPGFKADVNLIDYENLSFDQPEVVYDLPTGARRLTQRAHGYIATVCSGEVIYESGVPTGAMPGQLVRGPQTI
jgi:N-acyl-D-aspartate/D-glutamate deacylase